MNRSAHLVWKALFTDCIEYCRLTFSDDHILVDSRITGIRDGIPFYVMYKLTMDTFWHTHHLSIMIESKANNLVVIKSDGKGKWLSGKDHVLHEFDGCIDVDISITPFTNTLPVKRFRLAEGESKEIKVVYIDLPSGRLKISPQRYTNLGNNQYKYENLDSEFNAVISLTEEGYVRHYPNLFELIHP